MVLENSGFSFEEEYAYILKPIQDLNKNWDVDLIQFLERYLQCLSRSTFDYERHHLSMNFVEAALVVQSSTNIYSKKVEYLWQTTVQLLQSLDLIKGLVEDKKKRDGAAQNKKLSAVERAPVSDSFIFVDLNSNESNVDKSDHELQENHRRFKFLTRRFLELDHSEPSSSRKEPLEAWDGDQIGHKQDYYVNRQISSDFAALQEFNYKVDIASERLLVPAVEPVWDPSCTVPLEVPTEPELGVPTEPAADDSDVDMEVPQQTAITNRENIVTVPPEPPTKSTLKGLSWDETSEDEKPLAERLAYRQMKFLPPRDLSRKQRHEQFDEVPTLNQFMLETMLSLDVRTRRLYTSPEFSTFMFAAGKEFCAQASNSYFLPEELCLDNEWRKDLDKDFLGFEEYALEDDEDLGFRGFTALDSEDEEDIVAEYFPDERTEVLGDKLPASAPMPVMPHQAPDLENNENQAERELITLDQYNNFFLLRQDPQAAEMAARVAHWHDTIKPRLLASATRGHFDIHQYGTELLDMFPKDKRKTTLPFRDMVASKPSEDVPRYLLASLQLANTYNVEISTTDTSELATDCVELTLLTAVRHHEHMMQYEP